MLGTRKKHVYSPRTRKRKRIFLFIKVFAVLFLILGLFGLFIFFMQSPLAVIEKFEITGVENLNANEILEIAVASSEGRKFLVFSKRNSFFFPKEKVRAEILNKFSQIKEVGFSRIGLSEMEIQITERQPAFRWCSFESEPEKKCFLVDYSGVVYEDAILDSNSTLFNVLGPTEGVSFGQMIISEKAILYIKDFIPAVKTISLLPHEPVSLSVKGPEDFALNYENGFSIFFDIDDPVARITENINLSLGRADVRNRIEELIYVDTRFGNRVFIK